MLVLVTIFHKRLKDFTLEYWLHGGLMGIFLMLGYYGQAAGLMFTTPGKSAFLMASYCVMVPFLFWLIGGERPTRYNTIAAVLCVTGIGLVSFQGSLSMGMADLGIPGVFSTMGQNRQQLRPCGTSTPQTQP